MMRNHKLNTCAMDLPQSRDQASSDSGYRFGRGHAWFAFAMTIALMVVDYLDRQVIVSLFPHIKAAWGLSDKQLGSLVSIVSVTVALGALPVALLADRWSRVRSIAAMAAVWSMATISCASPSSRTSSASARPRATSASSWMVQTRPCTTYCR